MGMGGHHRPPTTMKSYSASSCTGLESSLANVVSAKKKRKKGIWTISIIAPSLHNGHEEMGFEVTMLKSSLYAFCL